MVKREILFNSKINEYTLEKEIDGVASEKRVPIKFKPEDSTAKFRRRILDEEISKNGK